MEHPWSLPDPSTSRFSTLKLGRDGDGRMGCATGITWDGNWESPGITWDGSWRIIQCGIWDRGHLGWVLWGHPVWNLGKESPGMGPGGSSSVGFGVGIIWDGNTWNGRRGIHGMDHEVPLGWDLGWI